VVVLIHLQVQLLDVAGRDGAAVARKVGGHKSAST
jgi:hypothetical protein